MKGNELAARDEREEVEIPLEVWLHDLANELANIRVNLEVLATAACTRCRSKQRSHMQTALTSVEQGLAIVEKCKATSPVALEPVSVVERLRLFEKAKPELERRYGLSIDLSHHVSKSCRVYSCMEIATEVARQILENSARAGATRVRVHYQEFPDVVEVVFADDGKGMTQREVEKLGVIDPSPMPSGGLGISIVRRLVQQANGTVWWGSRKNVGTWVTLHLRKVARRSRGA